MKSLILAPVICAIVGLGLQGFWRYFFWVAAIFGAGIYLAHEYQSKYGGRK